MKPENDLQAYIKTNSPLQDTSILAKIYSFDEDNESLNNHKSKRFSVVEREANKEAEEEEESKEPATTFKP